MLPSLRGADGGAGALADERYRAHRAVRRLLELIADERPLVLVLDDLHWSDGASIELIAALVRRPPAAPVLLALGFRPGQAAERLAAALARPAGEPARARAARARPRRPSCSTAPTRSSSPAIYSHAGGNPFYLEQLGARPAREPRAARSRRGATGRRAPAVAAADRGGARALSPRSRAFLDAAAVAGEPFEPDLAAAIAELSERRGARRARRPARARPRPPDRASRAASASATRSCGARSTRRRAAAGGWPPTQRAAEALGARGADAGRARPPRRAVGAARATRRRSRCCSRPAGPPPRGRPAAAARWFEAALRLLPSGDAERQVEVRVALASAQRSLGELDRCRATLLEATELLPPDAAMRRVELTALCAAVEHWQGHHEDAHRRLRAGVGGAARPRRRPRPRRCRSSWPSTASTRTTSSRPSRWARRRSRPRARSATAG